VNSVLLNASIIKPPNFDAQKKYPVLVSTYGGPHGASGPQRVGRLQLPVA